MTVCKPAGSAARAMENLIFSSTLYGRLPPSLTGKQPWYVHNAEVLVIWSEKLNLTYVIRKRFLYIFQVRGIGTGQSHTSRCPITSQDRHIHSPSNEIQISSNMLSNPSLVSPTAVSLRSKPTRHRPKISPEVGPGMIAILATSFFSPRLVRNTNGENSRKKDC